MCTFVKQLERSAISLINADGTTFIAQNYCAVGNSK
jgi:hypothetical protein